MNLRRQIRLSPEEQAVLFRKHRKAALATLDQDGFPHVVAMNYFVKDGDFYMTSYGKAQKVLNIQRNNKVALMIEEGNAYSELRGVMVRGIVRLSKAPTPFARHSREWPRRGARHTRDRRAQSTARQNGSC